MKKIAIKTIMIALTINSYAQSDSITISKSQLEEMYSFIDGSIKWIEKEDGNGVELDKHCKWLWILREELKYYKTNTNKVR